MAKKPLFEKKSDAWKTIEQCLNSIDEITPYNYKSIDPSVFYASGVSLVHHTYAISEVLLDLVCNKRILRAPGKKEWPRIAGLLKQCEDYNYVDAPGWVCEAADSMKSLKRSCDSQVCVSPTTMKEFFIEAKKFVGWLETALEDDRSAEEASRLLCHIDEWIGCCAALITINNSSETGQELDERWYQRHHGNIDMDNMTDDELDEVCRARMSNSRKSLAPLYIYQILRQNPNKHFLINAIIEILDKDYEIAIGRNAVLRHLNTMIDDDIDIWGSDEIGVGYWYSETDENAKSEIEE